MKLQELKQIQYSTTIEGQVCTLVLIDNVLTESTTAKIDFGSTASQSNKSIVSSLGKKAMDFFKNPIVAGLTVGWALNKLDDYNRARKYSIKFYARAGEEKNFYQKMVDDLLATGKYSIVKSGSTSGGYTWQLKRKWGS